MRAIVHIGLPKTGTSSFQNLLFEQHDRLLETGIRILTYDGPDDQFALPTRAFDLANCVVRTDLDVWWRAYIPESSLASFIERGRNSIRQQVLQPEELLIASVEDLFLIRTNEEVHRLKGLLEPREVRIVLTIRDRESWLRSLRAQLIAARIRPFSNWEDSCRNLRSDSWLGDFGELESLLVDHFGMSSVKIIDYDREMERCGSILPALCSACDLPPELISGPMTVTVPWSNPTKGWADAADPPPGTDDEVEWLRLRVLSQAWELERLRRVVARLRILPRPVEFLLGSAPRTGRSSHLGQKRVRGGVRSKQMGKTFHPPRGGRS